MLRGGVAAAKACGALTRSVGVTGTCCWPPRLKDSSLGEVPWVPALSNSSTSSSASFPSSEGALRRGLGRFARPTDSTACLSLLALRALSMCSVTGMSRYRSSELSDPISTSVLPSMRAMRLMSRLSSCFVRGDTKGEAGLSWDVMACAYWCHTSNTSCLIRVRLDLLIMSAASNMLTRLSTSLRMDAHAVLSSSLRSNFLAIFSTLSSAWRFALPISTP
mmetsp:Transcript_28877/g.77783  ORF Transcript_28877/g.77783 Transcript_28877/m.77783 type:complete len:220 (+) Transcript_28877:344-1003(+)